MGKGVPFMEKEGKADKATWHGKTAKPDEAARALEALKLSATEQEMIQSFKKTIAWRPKKPSFPSVGSSVKIRTGKSIVYTPDVLTDCRSAYGAALTDLAKNNKHIIALTADLTESVKTDGVKKAFPARHIDVGIAEQHMVSCAGGLSLSGFIPFASTFGAFMTSRAKDQARVNDINQTNVKMVATHCGLSVGEDGPTHQAIDDMGSMLGLLNTMVMEPADPNHCDRLIRFAASHYGNMYIRMGRHKIPVLTKEDGAVFFDESYHYYYGRCDVLRAGSDMTIAASGSTVAEALAAVALLKEKNITAELIIVSSPKQFDNTLKQSLLKTKKLLTVEDHNTFSGVGSQLLRFVADKHIPLDQTALLGVDAYQLSGKADELYRAAGIDRKPNIS